ncbi:MAG: hypothetical protein ACOCVR_02075 [Myxococcota bacterium]
MGTCLLKLGHISRGALLQSLASYLDLGPAPPSRVLRPDPVLAGMHEPDRLRRLRALPYHRDSSSLYVAAAVPRFFDQAVALAEPGERAVLRVATEPDVIEGLDYLFGPSDDGEREGLQIPRRPPRVLSPSSGEGESLEAEALWPIHAPGEEPEAESRPGSKEDEGGKAKSFRNEDEVAFARATGFDKERTAVFRLDDLAARHRGKKAEAAKKKALQSEHEERLTWPETAPSLVSAVEEIFSSPNEGVIARRLVSYLGAFFPRVLLLARHGEMLRGLLARGIELSGPQVVAIRVPSQPFSRLFSGWVGYYGPPPGGKELEPLYQALGTIGVNALLIPIDGGPGAAWMIYADHGEDLGRYEDVHDLEMMAKEVAIALELKRGLQE